MNAIILSAILGVVMMFSGILLKQKQAIREPGICRTFYCHCFERNGNLWLSFVQNKYRGHDAVRPVCTFL